MRYKHFALEIDFVYFVPAKMLRSFAGHKCANARIIYADVLLRSAVILDRMRIYAVGLQAASYAQELIHGQGEILSGLSLLMQLDYLLLQTLRLPQC